MKNWLFLSMLCLCTLFSFAQRRNYTNIDTKVAAFGALATDNVAVIATKITGPFADKEDKARAIFYWIANHITLDAKASRDNDQKNALPEKVIQLRKATPLGVAKLYQEMASQAGIRCLTVDGFVKYSWHEINEAAEEANFTWNVVQLGQSPEEWFYVDAAMGAGWFDDKRAAFVPSFNDAFFFTDKAVFNQTHYPQNLAWLLGAGAKSKKEFYTLPFLKPASVFYGVQKPNPGTGFLKVKLNQPQAFSFPTNGREIAKVEVVMGEGKKATKPEEVKFSSGNTISFSYTFKKEDSFPLKILFDGKEVAAYSVEVVEKK